MPRATKRFLRLCLAAIVVVSIGNIRQAESCVSGGAMKFETNANEIDVDISAPTMPKIVETRIVRGTDGGCSTTHSSCDDIGKVVVTLSSSDDRTPADKLGYRFELVSGEVPEGMAIPTFAMAGYSGTFYFTWVDGSTRGQEEFAFTLRARAVDFGGHESPPIEIAVHNGGRMGCTTTGSNGNSGDWPLLLIVLGFHWIRHRRLL
jgi:hypothetical protein